MTTASTELISTAVVAETLVATPNVLRTLLAPVPAALHTWRADERSWSINEVIGHLIAVDQVAFANRIVQMVDQAHPTLTVFDVHALAEARQDQQRTVDSLLTELAEGRNEYALLVRSLTPAQMQRTGYHSKYGNFCVSDFVYEWAYHDHAHLQQIMEIMKQAVWPCFGAAMQGALGG